WEGGGKERRKGGNGVKASPTELLQRNHFDVGCPIHRIAPRGDAEQPQDLGYRLTFGLYVVNAPEHHCDCFREPPSLFRMTLEQRSGGLFRPADGDRRGHRIRINRVSVSPCWQYGRVLDYIRAWTWFNVVATKRSNQAFQ